jgi:hypothetical protein
MTTIKVRPLRLGHYAVQVTEGTDTTNHEVVIDPRLLDDLDLTDYDEAVVAQEAVAFLLDRAPADSLGATISLRDVDRVHPDFRDELEARVEGRASEPEA